MFDVDLLIFLFMTPDGLSPHLRPLSTTIRSVLKHFARTATPVMPRVKLTVCAYVTDWGAEATPSSTTPLSEHMMITQRLSRVLKIRPVIPASFAAISSSLPRLPGGFTRLSSLFLAALTASRSMPVMPAIYFSRLFFLYIHVHTSLTLDYYISNNGARHATCTFIQ